jgi:hypothetical protein
MNVYGNVATIPQRKISKTLNRGYFEFRLAESLRTSPLAEKSGATSGTCWYTVRIMKDEDPGFAAGNFIRATGALKVDSFVGRDGKPASSLVLIAFDVCKVVKPEVLVEKSGPKDLQRPPVQPQANTQTSAPTSKHPAAPEPATIPVLPPEQVQEAVEMCESDWSTLYP